MKLEAAEPAATPLLVFPCNGNAIEALDCLQPRFRLLAFVDDTLEKQDSVVHGHRVVGRAGFKDWKSARVLAVPGSPTSFRARPQLIQGLRVDPSRFAQVIHPDARVSPLARIGQNVLIMAGAVITSNAVIGDHVCVLPNTVIHHDVSIGDWSLVGSNVTLAGGVKVGENCYIGSGTSVMQGLCIGAGALVGLGSTVIRHVPAHSTVAGCPARVLHA